MKAKPVDTIIWIVALCCVLGGALHAGTEPRPTAAVLNAESFQHYVEDFNRQDNELYAGSFPNTAAWDFLKNNIPWLDCPDEDLQATYYFRWWTYRKHLKQTPGGFIVDEFLPPVPWAGKYNSISCAAGHHLYEGRWLRHAKFLDDYSRLLVARRRRTAPLQFLGRGCDLGALLCDRRLLARLGVSLEWQTSIVPLCTGRIGDYKSSSFASDDKAYTQFRLMHSLDGNNWSSAEPY